MEDLSEEIQKAYERLHDMSLSEEERDVAERRCKDLASIEGAKKYEHELGKEEGKIEGKIEGKKERELEIAKNMLKKNLDIKIIEECTRLTEEEIIKLKE